jgi:AcrR family transcriptional regulator
MILVREKSRREAILDAALECFVERGVAATTIEDVRAQSGASVGSIYHHFSGKEGIAAALYVAALRDYQAAALEALRAGGIRGLVEHYVEWIAADPQRARYLLTRREPEVARASRDELAELNRAFFAAIRAWVEASELRPLPLDLFHAVALGPAQEWARHWLSGRGDTEPAEAARVLADAAEAAIQKEPR